jgi:hypothetical protein
MNQPQSLYGMKVVVSRDIPKMKLADGDYVTPEFRQEIDAWLLEFFGVTNLLPDGQVLSMQSANSVYMNPRTFAQFKAAAAKGAV